MWDYDVALLHLGETIVMNDIIRPICLPNTAEQQALVRLFDKNTQFKPVEPHCNREYEQRATWYLRLEIRFFMI